jgi:hypothetical protein
VYVPAAPPTLPVEPSERSLGGTTTGGGFAGGGGVAPLLLLELDPPLEDPGVDPLLLLPPPLEPTIPLDAPAPAPPLAPLDAPAPDPPPP